MAAGGAPVLRSIARKQVMQRLCTPSVLRECFQKALFGFIRWHLQARNTHDRHDMHVGFNLHAVVPSICPRYSHNSAVRDCTASWRMERAE